MYAYVQSNAVQRTGSLPQTWRNADGSGVGTRFQPGGMYTGGGCCVGVGGATAASGAAAGG